MTNAIACPNCFSNWGFRQSIARNSKVSPAVCPMCATIGPLIDRVGLQEAMYEFFVAGSYLPETMAPVYQVNDRNPNPARFDLTLDDDAKLACALTSDVIFDYGPAMWRFGEVNLKHAFDEGGSHREEAALNFVARAPRIELPIGTRLFRVRKNPKVDETITTAAAFDPPPAQIVRSPGRWDDGQAAVLYASDDIELCLHECRVLLADEIIVASLATALPLKLLDLTADFDGIPSTPFDDPGIFARFLSLSRNEQWLDHARAVSRAAFQAGLDGIRYKSYYGQAKQQSGALNVALFGRPIEAGTMTIESVNRVRLTDAHYQFSFGPVLYCDSEMEEELARMIGETEGGTTDF